MAKVGRKKNGQFKKGGSKKRRTVRRTKKRVVRRTKKRVVRRRTVSRRKPYNGYRRCPAGKRRSRSGVCRAPRMYAAPQQYADYGGYDQGGYDQGGYAPEGSSYADHFARNKYRYGAGAAATGLAGLGYHQRERLGKAYSGGRERFQKYWKDRADKHAAAAADAKAKAAAGAPIPAAATPPVV